MINIFGESIDQSSEDVSHNRTIMKCCFSSCDRTDSNDTLKRGTYSAAVEREWNLSSIARVCLWLDVNWTEGSRWNWSTWRTKKTNFQRWLMSNDIPLIFAWNWSTTMTSLRSLRMTYSSREEFQNAYPQEVIGVIMWMIVVVRRGILRLVHFEKLIFPFERCFNRVHIVRIERIVERMLQGECIVTMASITDCLLTW